MPPTPLLGWTENNWKSQLYYIRVWLVCDFSCILGISPTYSFENTQKHTTYEYHIFYYVKHNIIYYGNSMGARMAKINQRKYVASANLWDLNIFGTIMDAVCKLIASSIVDAAIIGRPTISCGAKCVFLFSALSFRIYSCQSAELE